ncbi:serine acetyltransferase [Rhodococcus rhodochrous]|uniref:serine O-acetyltransferase n=1 Tax=Rhodococcus rhodochrous TaxID=1829 RepID=UPI00132E7C22|nr:DapH/DapD/GlmU-related protein [Rhodococcus rhodochrous]QHG82216.1 serine acetyltransferase [Rhodococcus rhodochrous]
MPIRMKSGKILCMAFNRHALQADLVANQGSAKGRLVMKLFRLGQALPPRVRRLYHPVYYVIVDIVMGISLPLQTQIGSGLILRHGQGIVISWKSTIGDGCEIHQNVTLGEKDNAAPQLRNNVTIGANAVLLGGITVGDDAYIGAGAIVLTDVPAGAVAIGQKARIISSPTRGHAG